MNDAEVERFLQNAATGGAALVEARPGRNSAGEIPSSFPVAARATQVTDLARGLTMRARLGRAAQDAPQRCCGSGRAWYSCRGATSDGLSETIHTLKNDHDN